MTVEQQIDKEGEKKTFDSPIIPEVFKKLKIKDWKREQVEELVQQGLVNAELILACQIVELAKDSERVGSVRANIWEQGKILYTQTSLSKKEVRALLRMPRSETEFLKGVEKPNHLRTRTRPVSPVEITRLYTEEGLTITEIAKRCQKSPQYITGVLDGRRIRTQKKTSDRPHDDLEEIMLRLSQARPEVLGSGEPGPEHWGKVGPLPSLSDYERDIGGEGAHGEWADTDKRPDLDF